jgi:hypothetical protein
LRRYIFLQRYIMTIEIVQIVQEFGTGDGVEASLASWLPLSATAPECDRDQVGALQS